MCLTGPARAPRPPPVSGGCHWNPPPVSGGWSVEPAGRTGGWRLEPPGRTGGWSLEPAEELAEVGDEQVGRVVGGPVTAAVVLVPGHDAGVVAFSEAPDRPE